MFNKLFKHHKNRSEKKLKLNTNTNVIYILNALNNDSLFFNFLLNMHLFGTNKVLKLKSNNVEFTIIKRL